MTSTGTRTPGDLVPLVERARFLTLLRALSVAVATLHATVEGDSWVLAPIPLLLGGVALVAVTLATANVRGRWQVPIFGGTLLADGALLVALTVATGFTASPLRWLVAAHVVVVSLVGSYRTGVKVTLWLTLLLLASRAAIEVGLLPSAGGANGEPIALLVTALWGLALLTSSSAAMNERELRRRRDDLEALARLAEDLERATEPDRVARATVDALVETFGFPRVLLADLRESPTVLATHGVTSRPTPGVTEAEILRTVVAERRPVLVQHLDADRDRWVSTQLPDARQIVVLPLTAEDRTLAALVLEHGPRGELSSRTLRGAERFASQAALALANAWLQERLEEQAATDALTGLANRRAFDEALAGEVERAGRSGLPLTLVVLDLDHFKRVNDTLGHGAGDAALVAAARAIQGVARGTDLAARIGGEEFALLLPATDREGGLTAAERVQAAVRSITDPVALTATIGVATAVGRAADADYLLTAADDALYRGKAAGRDQIVRSDRSEVH
jgi:two-component system, cell cycle response regulator